MREIELKHHCSVPVGDCKRNKECKWADCCDGYNDCGDIKDYHDKVTFLWEEALLTPRPYEFCEDCDHKFYICPKLILVCD